MRATPGKQPGVSGHTGSGHACMRWCSTNRDGGFPAMCPLSGWLHVRAAHHRSSDAGSRSAGWKGLWCIPLPARMRQKRGGVADRCASGSSSSRRACCWKPLSPSCRCTGAQVHVAFPYGPKAAPAAADLLDAAATQRVLVSAASGRSRRCTAAKPRPRQPSKQARTHLAYSRHGPAHSFMAARASTALAEVSFEPYNSQAPT